MPSSDVRLPIEWLFAQKPRGGTYGIDRMRALAEALGHPERATPCIHIAGTNGKGSVAAMLESIFRTAGRRVGLYTSPHLVHVGERVQIDRRPLTDQEIARYVDELQPVAVVLGGRDLAPSFFEYMTAVAFLEFERRRCDLAILEVGLGGRLDATNIVQPQVSVITSIGFDHCELLGNTIEQIAAEKAGIVKAGVPVVVGRVPAAARRVIAEIAAERCAPAAFVSEHFGEGSGPLPVTNLEGEYQRWNAATATLAARAFEVSLPAGDQVAPVSDWRGRRSETGATRAPTSRQIAAGLQLVSWPGRWERRQIGDCAVILDASHNPEGAQALDQNLRALVAAEGRKPTVVVGVLGAARAAPLLEAIARHAAAIHLVMPDDPRATSHAELRGLIPPGFAGDVVDDTVARLFPAPRQMSLGQDASGTASPRTVVITGSIYLIGEVMRRLG